ncbi:MAG: hypothetical protein ACOX1S_03865 [Anaerostipes sp.]|jgi:hypothetical protein
MSEVFKNVLLNTLVMELLITVEFTIVICGLFRVSKKKIKHVAGICFFKVYFLIYKKVRVLDY